MTDDTQQVRDGLTAQQITILEDIYLSVDVPEGGYDKRTIAALERRGLIESQGKGHYKTTEIRGSLFGGDEPEKAPPSSPPEPENLDYVPEYATKSKKHARMVKLARDFHRNSPGMGAAAITAQIAGRCSTMDITAPSLEMVESWLPSSE